MVTPFICNDGLKILIEVSFVYCAEYMEVNEYRPSIIRIMCTCRSMTSCVLYNLVQLSIILGVCQVSFLSCEPYTR